MGSANFSAQPNFARTQRLFDDDIVIIEDLDEIVETSKLQEIVTLLQNNQTFCHLWADDLHLLSEPARAYRMARALASGLLRPNTAMLFSKHPTVFASKEKPKGRY